MSYALPDKEFFQELKDQFQREVDLKDKLDTKAAHLMTIAGTVTTLLLGMVVFVFGQINVDTNLIKISFALLIAGIICGGLSLFAAVLTHITKNYTYPIGEEVFYKNNQIDKETIKKFRESSDKKFYSAMIEEYLFSIKENSKENRKKSRTINGGHVTLLAAILITIFAIITLYFGILESPDSFSLFQKTIPEILNKPPHSP